MNNDALWSASMTQLLARMRAGELSPVELLDAHVARIEAVNPVLHAVVAERYAEARVEAQRAEREYAAGDESRPLLGVPFTVKEMIAVRGMPQTFGSLSRRHRVADVDATAVARLRAAGAIPLGVTNVPEWGMWFESYNKVYGRTNNPWDVQRTPGGSSGGEGAVVGAGGSLFGIGSDIGGSVRMPAAFCGVVGHKPTTGLVPLTGHYPVYATGPDALLPRRSPYVTLGTLTRSAADVAPLLRAMAGRDGIDPNAEPIAFRNPERVDWAGRHVLLLPSPYIRRAARASDDMAACVERAGRSLAARGADVAYAPARLLQHAADVWFAALQSVGGRSFAEILGSGTRVRLHREIPRALVHRSDYSWPALFFCVGERFGRRSEIRVRAALRELRRLSRRIHDLVGSDGVLLCPPHPRVAPRHNGAILHPYDFLYTAAFNALRMPATTVPCGFDADGMPLSVQLAANRGCDHLTLAAALAVERDAGPWRPASVELEVAATDTEPGAGREQR
jgi:fatty acid amide hydrolase 2